MWHKYAYDSTGLTPPAKRHKRAYYSLRSNQIREWLVEPYFVEMTGVGYSVYLIGNAISADRKGIITFKLSRIREIELLAENFEIPEGLSLDGLLSSSWGVMYGEDVKVKLKFSRAVTRRVKESIRSTRQEWVRELPSLIAVKMAGRSP